MAIVDIAVLVVVAVVIQQPTSEGRDSAGSTGGRRPALVWRAGRPRELLARLAATITTTQRRNTTRTRTPWPMTIGLPTRRRLGLVVVLVALAVTPTG